MALRHLFRLTLAGFLVLRPLTVNALGENVGRNAGATAVELAAPVVQEVIRRLGYTISPINDLLLDLTGKDPEKKQQAEAMLKRMLGPDFLSDTAKVYQVRVWVTGLSPGQSFSVSIVPTATDPNTPLLPDDPDARMKRVIGKIIWTDSSDVFNTRVSFKGGSALTGASYHNTLDDVRSTITTSYLLERKTLRLKWQPRFAPECPQHYTVLTGGFSIDSWSTAPGCGEKIDAFALGDAVTTLLDDRVDRQHPDTVAQTQWQGQRFVTLLVPANDAMANPHAVLHMIVCQDEDQNKLIPYYRLKTPKETMLPLAERAGDWTYLSQRKDPDGKPMRFRAIVTEIPY